MSGFTTCPVETGCAEAKCKCPSSEKNDINEEGYSLASCLHGGRSEGYGANHCLQAAGRALKEADFALVATHPMNAALIQSAPKLRMIQHQGVGYERTDVEAAREKGIPVALCPEGRSLVWRSTPSS
jgi:hypothetical protein